MAKTLNCTGLISTLKLYVIRILGIKSHIELERLYSMMITLQVDVLCVNKCLCYGF